MVLPAVGGYLVQCGFSTYSPPKGLQISLKKFTSKDFTWTSGTRINSSSNFPDKVNIHRFYLTLDTRINIASNFPYKVYIHRFIGILDTWMNIASNFPYKVDIQRPWKLKVHERIFLQIFLTKFTSADFIGTVDTS